MKTKKERSYKIIHDPNDLLEVLGYPSRKQVEYNHAKACGTKKRRK